MALIHELRRFAKDTMFYGIAGVLPKAALFFLIPVYTRYLTPSDYGLLALATMIGSMLGTVMLLGQNGSIILLYREEVEHQSSDSMGRYLYTVTMFTLGFAGLIFAAGLLLGPTLIPVVMHDDSFGFYPYMVLVLGTTMSGIPLVLLQSANRARRRVKLYTGLQLGSFVLTTFFTVYFVVWRGRGAEGSLAGALVGGLIMAPVAVALLGRHMERGLSLGWLKKSLAFGTPLVPHFFAGWVLLFSDRFILERFASLADVGLYSLAYNISLGLTLLTGVINEAWSPFYYEVADRGEDVALRRLTTIVAVAYTVLSIGFVLFSREVLAFMAASDYRDAAGVVPIVAGACYAQSLYFVLSTGLFYAGNTRLVPIISGAAALLNVCLNLLLVPRYGMYGAAWATLASYAAMAISAHALTRNVRPGSFEGGRLVRLVALFVAAFTASLALDRAGLAPVVGLIAKTALFILCGAAILVLDIVSWSELARVVRVVANGRRALRL